MLSFRCGQCGKGLAVGDELAGKPVRCPGCNKVVAAPQPAKVAVPSSAAPGNLGLTSLGDSSRPGDTPSASAVECTRNDTVVVDEDARKRFESAWRAGTPVTIEKFLTDQSLSHFVATLEELVHIDIEFHWKTWSESAVASSTGRPGAVESYLTRFPQLKRADILQRLVETEFRVRQRLGDKPAAADYRVRFPHLKLTRLDPQAGPDVTGFLAPAQKSDELGRLGPYRVVEILGRGGMGVVFKAEDTLLQRMVALKAMLPALAGSPTAKERFFREAKAAASLKHPHIVTIHQVGEDRGAPFLAMEFLEGESLDDRLKREKKLPIAEVLRIGIEVAEGLACAHEKGLIHRDIKPANIWLETNDEGGRMKDEKEKVGSSSFRFHPSSFCAKILDFGLARALAEQTQLTQSGVIVGTPAYMAPEQAGGKEVDHRADLFSLGCVLYRACTGEMPFKGNDTMSILSAIALQSPKPPAERNPEVTQGLSEVIMALLAKEASDRPATARAVAQMLREFAADGIDTALLRFDKSKKSAPAQPRLPPGPRLQALQALAIRKKKSLLWGGAAVLAVLLVFALASRERQRPEQGTNGNGNPLDGQTVGYLLTFDGNSTVVVPSLILDRTEPITLEAIVTESGQPRNNAIFVFGVPNQFSIALTRLNPEFGLRWDPGLSSLRSKAEVDPGHPVHLAGVLDKTSFRGYVDGRQVVATSRQGKGLGEAGVFRLGARHFKGSIREVRISRTARYNKEFTPQQRFEPDADTLALYHCDEGTGDVLKDSSGNGHDGKIVGAKWVRQDASPYDQLRRADIDPYELKIAGGGDPAKAAPELVAIFGDSRLMHGNRGAGFAVDANVAFSPNGDRLVSVDGDAMLRVWDAKTGAQLHVLDVGARWPRVRNYLYLAVSLQPYFSPDGQEVVFLAESVMRAWNLATGEVRALPLQHQDAVVLKLSRDHKIAATQGVDGKIQVWDVPTGKLRLSLQSPPLDTGISYVSSVTLFALSGDGRRLAFVKDKIVTVWNVFDNKEEQILPSMPSCGHLAFNAAGDLLGIPTIGLGERKDAIAIWDLTAKKPRPGLSETSIFVTFSPDGRYVANPGTIWDLATGKVRLRLKNPQARSWDYQPWLCAFAPDSARIASVGKDGRIRVWDLAGKDLLPAKENDWSTVSGAVTANQVITCEDNGQVYFWDLRTRRARMLSTKIPGVRLLQPRPDGKKLALCRAHGGVTVLDVASGATLYSIAPPDGFATDTTSAVNADCTLIAAGGEKGVMLWNLEKGRQRQLPIPYGGYRFLFTSDQRLIAALHDRLSVWDLSADKLVTDFRLPRVMTGANLAPARISPDSSFLGSGMDDAVSLIDLNTGEITKEFPKQELLAFSPDGKKLATTGGSTLSIWNPRSGTRERRIDLGLGQVPAFLDYAPDGRHIVVGNANGTVFVLRLGERRE